MGEKNPEVKGRPNPIEKKPRERPGVRKNSARLG